MLKPVGLTQKQFRLLSAVVRSYAGDLGNEDIRVHGSRAVKGKARPDSDLDIAIRLASVPFHRLISRRFGKTNTDSAKERTMLQAIKTGKIQAGEAGLSVLRRTLEAGLDLKVDISVIKIDGPFDNGPWVEILKFGDK